MRWMWIDRIIELEPRQRLVAIKHISLAEEHLHDHFTAEPDQGLAAAPTMPACFIIEGMAQSAGILVGHAGQFKEKVVLAKVSKVNLTEDAAPGDTLRYTATITRMDDIGAQTQGIVELLPPGDNEQPRTIGQIDLMFSHLDNNMGGQKFPEHNFVFSDSFRTLLTSSGIAADF